MLDRRMPMVFPPARCDRCYTRPPRYTLGHQVLCRWCVLKRVGLGTLVGVGTGVLIYRVILDVVGSTP
jgi:hypothetical protein